MTGMMIGGVTALALPQGLPIYADMRLLEMDYIILGAGSRSGKLKMAPQELGETSGSGVHRGIVAFGGVTAAGSRKRFLSVAFSVGTGRYGRYSYSHSSELAIRRRRICKGTLAMTPGE